MTCKFPVVLSSPARKWFLPEVLEGEGTSDDQANGHDFVLQTPIETDPNILGVHSSP